MLRTNRFARIDARLLGFTLAVSLASTTVASAQIQFREAGRIPVGESPLGLSVADLDGDGQKDLLVSNRDSDTVSVILRGAFASTNRADTFPTLPTADQPNYTRFADFNEDGLLDIAVLCRFGPVQVRLGDGLGGFGPPFDGCRTANSQAMAIGDFNGDTHSDIAVASYSKVYVQLGDGAGGFSPCVLVHDGGPAVPYGGMIARDLNADGFDDLVAAVWGRARAETFIANGDGTFEPPIGVGTAPHPNDLIGRDLDGDGHLDLVAPSGDDEGAVTVLRGTGSESGPRFAPVQFASTGGSVANSIVIADLDLDGEIELIVTHRESGDIVILARNDHPSRLRFEPVARFEIGGQPRAVRADDFNRDGRPDLIVALQGADQVVLLRNTTR